MKIPLKVDEEFAKALEEIAQPYLDRQALIKKYPAFWIKAVQDRIGDTKIFRGRNKHMEGC